MLCGALAAYAVGIADRQPVGRRRSPARRRRRCSPPSTPSSCSSRGANQLATGLVVLFLGLGLTSLFGAAYVGQADRRVRAVADPGLVEHPVHRADPVRPRPAHLPVVLRRPRCMWWLLFRSRWGLLVRAAGERAEVLHTLRHVAAARSATSRSSSAACSAGIGGAQLSIAYTNTWFENMTPAGASSPSPS